MRLFKNNDQGMLNISLTLILILLIFSLSLNISSASAQVLKEKSKSKFSRIYDYIPLTYENLIYIYLVLGKKNDRFDDAEIDDFLKLTECNLYNKFYKDDIAWEEIRNAARSKLDRLKNDFPTTIFVAMPFQLDRYELEKGAFMLTPATAFPKSSVLPVRVESGATNPGCSISFRMDNLFPSDFILTLDVPILLTSLQMSRSQAQALLENKDFQSSDRTLYLKLYITLNKYKGSKSDSIGGSSAHNDYSYISAKIDAAEVYKDATLIHKFMDVPDITPARQIVQENFK